MRLMIAEKHSQALAFIDAGLVPEDTHIILTIGFGLWRYKLPRLKFSDIPYTENPSDLEPRFNIPVRCLAFMPDRKILIGAGDPVLHLENKEEKEKQLSDLLDFLKSNLSKYEEIIICVDNDRTGMYSAKQLLDMLPKENLPRISCVRFLGMDLKSLEKGWHDRDSHLWGNNCFGEKFASEHQVKKNFDYWWHSNSMMVFNELCIASSLYTKTTMSKYELMTIAIMSQQEHPISIDKLLKALQRWKGTGKYDSKELWGVIGSAASRNAIIENAVERGALSIDEQCKKVSITESGKKFISLLHPKTFDPDLPFRLDKWCIDQDYHAVKRYIRTLFGRQIRYQRVSCKNAKQDTAR